MVDAIEASSKREVYSRFSSEARPEKIERRRGVFVGIGSYEHQPLRNAPRDAEAVARLLASEYGFSATLLLNGEASHEAIERALRDDLDRADTGTRWVFFFAGHGTEKDGTGYLVPVDGRDDDVRTWLPLADLLDLCLASKCGEILIILDTCHAGQALIRDEELNELLDSDREKNWWVRQILCSGNPYEPVRDDGGQEHSAFTQCLLEALEGWAGIHDADDALHFRPLLGFLQSNVKRRLEATFGKGLWQSPIGGSLVGNAEGREFVFRPVVPRIPSGLIQALRSKDAEVRLKGLTELANQGRCPAMAMRLAAEHVKPAPHRSAAERAEAAKTLGRLARLPVPNVEENLGKILMEMVLADPSPAVLHQARKALGRTRPEIQRRAAGSLLSNLQGNPSSLRRNSWQALAMLPAARRELPLRQRLRVPLTRARQETAAFGRALTATQARRRALVSLPSLVFLGSLGLASSYYLSTFGQSTIVIRAGHPGFKFLPGVGRPLVVTDHDAQDLDDRSLALEERLTGSWLGLENGAFPWGEQIFDHLDQPAGAGLAWWRMGDSERAFKRLRQGVDSGDVAAVEVLGYLSLQSEAAVDPAVDLLVRALEKGDAPHQKALTTLILLRDLRPRAIERPLARLSGRLGQASGQERAALLEAVEVLSHQGERASRATAEALLALLQKNPEDREIRLQIARAVEGIARRHPGLLAGLAAELCEHLKKSAPEDRGSWLSILSPAAPLPADTETLLARTLVPLLEREENPRAAVVLVSALGVRLRHSPSLDRQALAALLQRLGDDDPWLRLTAARSLAALPPGRAPEAALIEGLADMIRKGQTFELRTDALELLGELRFPGSRSAILDVLIATTGDGRDILRELAVMHLLEAGFDSEEGARRALPVLRSLLRDHTPGIRREAAIGTLLLEGNREEDAPVAFAEVVRGLGSGDPTEARNMRNALAESFRRASPGARSRLSRRLTAHAATLDVFTVQPFLDLLDELQKRQPDFFPDFILALTDLLASPDPEGDVPDRARLRLLAARNLPPKRLAPAIKALLGRLASANETERAAAAEVLGDVSAGHAALAAQAIRRLAPLFGDPAARVQAGAAAGLGVIASQQPGAVRDLLGPLLAGLKSPSPAVRAACGLALRQAAAEPSLSGRAVPALLTAVEDADPAVRREATVALAHWGRRAQHPVGDAPARLQRQLARETDPAARLHLAAALAELGGEDPEIVQQVIRLAQPWLASADRETRFRAVFLLRHLRAPAAGRQAIDILQTLLRDEDLDLRRQALVVLFLVGAEDADNAARVADLVGPLLLDPEWPGRWDALANNLAPLTREQPIVAPRTVRWLRELLASDTLGSGSDHPLLVRTAVDTLTEALTVLARSDPEALWPLLLSANRFERQVGREVLARLVAERPERGPEILKRLERHRRSLHPHVRLSAAQSREMIALLLKTEEILGKPEEIPRWSEVLKSFPRVDVDAAVHLALDKLEPGIKHG
jgi:HEAT repeat protein